MTAIIQTVGGWCCSPLEVLLSPKILFLARVATTSIQHLKLCWKNIQAKMPRPSDKRLGLNNRGEKTKQKTTKKNQTTNKHKIVEITVKKDEKAQTQKVPP